MPMTIAYWVVMLLLLIFGAMYVFPTHGTFVFSAQFVLIFILFCLIGWKVFGRPVQ